MRLIRKAFSDDEWALLSAEPGFMDRVNRAGDIDEADRVIRAGAQIIERITIERQSPRSDRPSGPRP